MAGGKSCPDQFRPLNSPMPTATEPPPVKEPKAKPAPKKGKSKPTPKPRNDKLPPFNVVLHDDNDHTYEYVIEMLKSVFAHPEERGFKLAKEVDDTGRVIVFTGHKELAELKREQVQSFGRDKRIASSKGGMTATVEPAA